jgi:hypothetical protein
VGNGIAEGFEFLIDDFQLVGPTLQVGVQSLDFQVALLALGDIHDRHAALLACRASHPLHSDGARLLAIATQGQLARFFFLARHDLGEKGMEDAPGPGGDKEAEAPADQLRPFPAQQASGGQIDIANDPVCIEGRVTDRGKIVQVSVFLQCRLHLGPGVAQILILHLQLDMVHLQFVQQLLRIISGATAGGSRPFLAQHFFRAAAQRVLFKRALFLVHAITFPQQKSSLPAIFTNRQASRPGAGRKTVTR